MTADRQARLYLRCRHYGVLSTISQKFQGYPFGSVVPYILDHMARPTILISRLAEHTKNVEACKRVSLLVSDMRDDVQAGMRLTLIGDAAPADDDVDAIRARYLEYFPDADRLLALGDFRFYRIEPRGVRFILGFGSIHWIPVESYLPPANTIARHEQDIISHTNTHHVEKLHDYCRDHHHRNVTAAAMIGVDCDGFDIRADGQILRFDFDNAVTSAEEVRASLALMTARCRGL